MTGVVTSSPLVPGLGSFCLLVFFLVSSVFAQNRNLFHDFHFLASFDSGPGTWFPSCLLVFFLVFSVFAQKRNRSTAKAHQPPPQPKLKRSDSVRSSTSKPPRLPPQAKPAHLAAAQHQSLPAPAARSRQNLHSSTSRFRGLRRKQNTHARTQSSLRGSTAKAHQPPRQTKFNGNDAVCSSTSKPPWPPAHAPVFVFHSSTSAPSGPLPHVKSKCPSGFRGLALRPPKPPQCQFNRNGLPAIQQSTRGLCSIMVSQRLFLQLLGKL